MSSLRRTARQRLRREYGRYLCCTIVLNRPPSSAPTRFSRSLSCTLNALAFPKRGASHHPARVSSAPTAIARLLRRKFRPRRNQRRFRRTDVVRKSGREEKTDRHPRNHMESQNRTLEARPFLRSQTDFRLSDSRRTPCLSRHAPIDAGQQIDDRKTVSSRLFCEPVSAKISRIQFLKPVILDRVNVGTILTSGDMLF